MLGKAIVGRHNLIAVSSGAALLGKYRSADRLTLCSGIATASPALSNITLYEYKICPFCNKVKAYLDFLDVDYKKVEVNPLTKSQLKFQKEYTKVPLITFNTEEAVGESAEIITKITEKLSLDSTYKKPDSSFYPEDTQEWSDWADKKLAVMLYPNITRTMSESYECFGYIDNVKEWDIVSRVTTKAVGSFAMSFANGKIKKKYGIVDERVELKDCLLLWTSALDGKDFLHGDTITMPDVLVFGVLRAIEGLQTFTYIMEENKDLSAWYGRMKIRIPHK